MSIIKAEIVHPPKPFSSRFADMVAELVANLIRALLVWLTFHNIAPDLDVSYVEAIIATVAFRSLIESPVSESLGRELRPYEK